VREIEEQPMSVDQQKREDQRERDAARSERRGDGYDRQVAVVDENGESVHAEALEAERGSHEPPHVQLSPRKVALLGLVLLVIFAIIFVVGYLPRLRDNRIIRQRSEQEQTAVPTVDVVAARRSSKQADLELPGTTAGLVEAPIYARASGYVSKRFVDIGDRVRAGQLMAVIDAPDLDQQVDQAHSTLQQSESVLGQTKAQLNLQKITWDRWAVLVQRGVLSRQDGDTQQANYLVAEANVKAAENTVLANRANLDRLLKLQGYERVSAPFNGIVTARNIDVGSLISASGGGLGSNVTGAALPPTGTSQGGEMFRVAQLDRLRLFVTVPEVYARYVTVGEDVNCYFDAISLKPFSGKVTRTANAVDPTTRTLLTEVQVPNPDGKLLPGMFTRAVFVNLRAQPPVIVPSDSIIARANGITIAVVQDDTVHIRRASIGRDYGAQTEVLAGVNPGELVIINPTDAAQDGARVKPHELKQGPAAGASTPAQQNTNAQPQGGPAQPQQGSGAQSRTSGANSQQAAPLNPEANVPLSNGPEAGDPGELQGAGPTAQPRPDYGPYNVPQQSQPARSGSPRANSGNAGGTRATVPGTTNSNQSSAQPH
jgi:multidrug efflux pump subunit AcrA (membrane-fusion protein)